MWLILPDEGTTPEELLASGDAMEFLQQDLYTYKNQKSLLINLSVPKFDISSDMELKDQLKVLGITDVFSPGKADFSAITADVPVQADFRLSASGLFFIFSLTAVKSPASSFTV